MEDPTKVDQPTTDEATDQQTTPPAQEQTTNGPQLGKQLNKRPAKKPAAAPAPTSTKVDEKDDDAAAPEEATEVEPQTDTTAAPGLSPRAKALKATLRFGLPKKEDQSSSRPTATATRTEATIAAEAIASRESNAEAKAAALTAQGKLYGKLARESALKGESYLRERALQTTIEKRQPEPAEIATELERAFHGLNRRLELAQESNDATVKADLTDKARREYSAELLRISDMAHPEYMLTSFGPNGEVSREPAKLVMGNTARQLLLILAVAPKEKIDEIIRETRRGNGDASRKAFYDPKGYGAQSALLKGGDELAEVYSIIQTLAFDRKGESIERVRFAQLAADYALAGDWNGAARCVDVLAGAAPVKKGDREVFTFPKDTPLDLIYNMVQAAIWKGHAEACRAEADRIRKEAEKKSKQAAFDVANPQPDTTRRNTEKARKETEPAPDLTPAPTEEERAKAQSDRAINDAKTEIGHLISNHKASDPWPKEKIRAISLSVARYHPDYAEKAERRKIKERNPNTDDATALTQEQFQGFCIQFGRELLGLNAEFKPETATN